MKWLASEISVLIRGAKIAIDPKLLPPRFDIAVKMTTLLA